MAGKTTTDKTLVQFNTGEVSPLLDSRIDLQSVAGACRRLRNMIVTTHGPVVRRPGLRFIASVKGYEPTPPEDCVYSLPVMADASAALLVDVATLAELPKARPNGSTVYGDYGLRCCMSESGGVILLGTDGEDSDSTTPKYLTRNGASFDVSEIALPADWTPPFNDVWFKAISRTGAFVGAYEANVSPGVHGTVGIFWPDKDTTPTLMTDFSTPADNSDTLCTISADGLWVIGQRDSDGRILYKKTDTSELVTLDATGDYPVAVGIDYCKKVTALYDNLKRFTRTPDTDDWTVELFESAMRISYVSGNGEAAVGHAAASGGKRTGAIFTGGALSNPTVLTTIGGAAVSWIYATRCNYDGSVVAGYYFDGDFNQYAFIWDAVNGARDLTTVAAAALDTGGVVFSDVGGVSATGKHFLLTGKPSAGLARAYYLVLP